MKNGMKIPGFSAEASVYKSTGRYMTRGVPGETTSPVVRLAAAMETVRMFANEPLDMERWALQKKDYGRKEKDDFLPAKLSQCQRACLILCERYRYPSDRSPRILGGNNWMRCIDDCLKQCVVHY